MKKPIALRLTGSRVTTVPAICRGDWGLHPAQRKRSAWSISHIPTGFRLVTIFSCFYARKCFRETASQIYHWDGQGETPKEFIDTYKPIAFRYLRE
uniref:Uncharacterized protein n=1 Tax=viral metagenome TaxID=1070528 RepID=A0A6H2A200_9ZZZZ